MKINQPYLNILFRSFNAKGNSKNESQNTELMKDKSKQLRANRLRVGKDVFDDNTAQISWYIPNLKYSLSQLPNITEMTQAFQYSACKLEFPYGLLYLNMVEKLILFFFPLWYNI